MPIPASFHAEADNIRRLIENQRAAYQPHAFRRNGPGMADFNFLLPILRALPARSLTPHLDHIDAVRMTHLDCRPCFCKALVYSILFSQNRLPARHRNYLRLFQKLRSPRTPARNYIEEVAASLLQNAVLRPEELQALLASLPPEITRPA
jgi:hypothetical protein